MYKPDSSEGARQGPIKIRDQFAKYQVNRLHGDSFMEAGRQAKRESVQELKIQKARIKYGGATGDPEILLPGMDAQRTPEKPNNEPSKDLSLSALFGEASPGWHELPRSKQALFGLCFLLFAVGRACLCPLMAWAEEPVVHKIWLRSIILAMCIGAISFFFRSSQPLQLELLNIARDTPQELRNLALAAVGYCLWIYCAVFASHFTSIIQVASLANTQFFILDLCHIFQRKPTIDEGKWNVLGGVAILLFLFVNPESHDLVGSSLNIDRIDGSTRFWCGNIVALLAGCFAAVHYRYSRRLKLNYSFSSFGMVCAIFSILFLGLLSFFYSGRVLNLPDNSILDILTSSDLLKIATATVMNGVIPNYLYGPLVKVFHPTVFSLAQTTNPFTAALVATLLAIQAFPGFGQLCAVGCFCVGMFYVRNNLVSSETETLEVDDALSVDSAPDGPQTNLLLKELEYLGRQKPQQNPTPKQNENNFVRDTGYLG